MADAQDWWADLRRQAPDAVSGLWFGLVELAHAGWHIYVAGTETFDPDDETGEWACEPAGRSTPHARHRSGRRRWSCFSGTVQSCRKQRQHRGVDQPRHSNGGSDRRPTSRPQPWAHRCGKPGPTVGVREHSAGCRGWLRRWQVAEQRADRAAGRCGCGFPGVPARGGGRPSTARPRRCRWIPVEGRGRRTRPRAWVRGCR